MMLNSELRRTLEERLQRAIDRVCDSPDGLAAARRIASSDAFLATSPSLATWLIRVLRDDGHENERLICLDSWSDIDVAAGLLSGLAMMSACQVEPLLSLAGGILELFAVTASGRLTFRAVERLCGGGEAA